jgi:hypothetical protein
MNLNNFKILDVVSFEIGGHGTKNSPRWSKNIDYGGSGIWATGVVRFVDEYVIKVEYEIENYVDSGFCNWPNFKNNDYKENQWSRCGFLKKIQCECGGEKTKTTHSGWCPKITISQQFKFIK